MLYHSTRGQSPTLPFNEVILRGLADDGGLYVPQSLPFFSSQQILSLKNATYEEIAIAVIKPFIGDFFTDGELSAMVESSYASFRQRTRAPICFISPQNNILELFHGPTYAFKDYALQFLSKALSASLQKKNLKAFLLGATSGDTGSAAIKACQNMDKSHIAILHPHQRVSEKQRRQMTTTQASNVHNLAVDGNFDNCQQIVKKLFNDKAFRNDLQHEGYALLAVNSINWGRLLAQIVYYFTAFISLVNRYENKNLKNATDIFKEGVVFSVPTGNFGNVYSAYIAKQMGIPIGKLIVATNSNDILHRFFSANNYSLETLHKTLSPSMDIMVSSNFERLVFHLLNEDGDVLRNLFADFSVNGKLQLPKPVWEKAKQNFYSHCSSDHKTIETIRTFYEKHRYLLDPHTAIAQQALDEYQKNSGDDRLALVIATAHPVKFDDAIAQTGLDVGQHLQQLDALLPLKEDYLLIENDYQKIRDTLLGFR